MPIGIGEPVKLKHIVTEEEIKQFVRYLNAKKFYILVVICMLLFKFGLRVGALAKVKVCDIMPNGIIIFREKNNKIIKRQLLKETFEILTLLIDECEIKDDSYLFYFFKFEDDENKRSLFFTQKFRNLLHDSHVFSTSSTESLSSLIFSVTHAINTYKGTEIENVRQELGHRFSSTSFNNYIKPEARQLNLLEELNIGEFKGIKFLNKKKERVNENNKKTKAVKNSKNIIQILSSSLENLYKDANEFNDDGEDAIDDDF